MDKFAQKRSIKHKAKELFPNFGPTAIKNYFNPEFQKLIEVLKSVDNNIRSIALGKSIDKGEFGAYAISLKDLIKSGKTNLNRREYMNFVSDMGKFHNKMEEIKAQIDRIEQNVDKTHHEYWFKDLDDDKKNVIKNLHEKYAFKKEAGIVDFLANISSKRGRALMAWEARYPHIVEKIKNESTNILNQAEKLYNLLIESLNGMAETRAAKNIDKYKYIADNFVSKQIEPFNESFKKYYKDQISLLIVKSKIFEKQDQANQSSNPSPQGPGPNVPSPPPSPIDPTRSMPKVELPPQPVLPGLEKLSPQSPKMQFSDVANQFKFMQPEVSNDMKAAHLKFYKALESMAGESPLILKKYINKYAASIQDKDLETAIKLFNVAKLI